MSMLLTGPAKIVRLSGSPRDQGRAHGLGCRKEIPENLDIIRRGMAKLATRGKQYDFDALIAANERFVERTAPEILEEIQGIAESSGVSYRDLLLINLPLYFVASFLPQECSQILLMPPATRDGKTYLAKTRDIGGGKLRNVVLHRRYSDGRELVEVNVAGSITWPGSGMNSDGVVLSTSGVWSKRTQVDLDRIGRGWLLVNGHLLLRDSRSFDDLVARGNMQPRVTGINMVTADTYSGAALEWTADRIYRQDAEQGVIVRTNHYITPEIQNLGPTSTENPSSHHRREVALARIKSKYGAFDLDSLATLLADHDGYPNLSLCRHSEGGVGSDTIYASIAVLPDGKFWSVVAVALFLVVACVPQPAPAPATAVPATSAPAAPAVPATSAPTAPAAPATAAPATSAPPPAQPKVVDKLTIGQGADINTLDPHQTASVGTDLSVISHIYSSLILRGPDMKLQPAVAESWQATSDTTWRFKLRGGITFPNGEKLDAAAVKWNIDRVLDPATKARVASWFAPVKEARVVDDTTLEVVTKQPYPAFADQLSMFFLLPPKWAAENNPAGKAMGTGAYTLKEWVKDDHVTLELKSDYWGPKPAFKTVIFKVIPETSSRVSGLLAGDLDIIREVTPADIGRINSSGRATAGATPSTRTAMVKFNTLKKPFDDVRARQALNYAVDKDALIKNLLNGLTEKSKGQVLTSAYFGYNPDLEPYPYDANKAKQLLADAGLANGFTADFDMPSSTYLLGDQIVQAIAEQLRQVGVQAKVTEMPFSVYMDKYLKEKNMAQMMYLTLAWPTVDADGLLTLFAAGNQYAYWDDNDFTNTLVKARSTTNAQQRQDLYKQATKAMREQAPVIFLFPQPATYAVKNTINWKARPDDWIRTIDMQPK